VFDPDEEILSAMVVPRKSPLASVRPVKIKSVAVMPLLTSVKMLAHCAAPIADLVVFTKILRAFIVLILWSHIVVVSIPPLPFCKNAGIKLPKVAL